jgi:hypothetical protein
MSESLRLACPSAQALADLLRRAGQTDTLLLPPQTGCDPEPLARRDLQLQLPNGTTHTACEVIQVLPEVGIVVRLLDRAAVERFANDSDIHDEAPAQGAQIEAPAQGAQIEAPAEEAQLAGRQRRISSEVQSSGITPLSWPIERLRTDWHALSQPERIRIARYGKRPARSLVLRTNDKKLMVFLLQNTRITADEVAVMAGMANLDPDLLRRIAASPDWTRHTAVARNLVCNPKLPSQLVRKLVDKLPLDELRRLARSGRVRSSTKQMIMRRVDRGR